MGKRENAYTKMKNKKNSSIDFKSVLKQEESYWFGAGGLAILFAGLIDGGVSVGLAYGAKKLYEHNNG